MDVQTLPLQSGPSRSPTLGRAVASSSHCQPVTPKALRARSRPIADPSEVHSSPQETHQKRSNTVKNDQKRSPTNQSRPKDHQKRSNKKVKQVVFRTWATHRAIAKPLNCSPEADHSHGCRSMFSIRDDCPQRAHTCGPFPDEKNSLPR